MRTVDGRTHRLDLNPGSLVEAAEWFDQQLVWARMFDAVDDILRERKERP